MSNILSIALHATDSTSLQRARLQVQHTQQAAPPTQLRIVASADAVAAALDSADALTDPLTYLCPGALGQLQRPCPAHLQMLHEPAALALARLQQHGWACLHA